MAEGDDYPAFEIDASIINCLVEQYKLIQHLRGRQIEYVKVFYHILNDEPKAARDLLLEMLNQEDSSTKNFENALDGIAKLLKEIDEAGDAGT